MKKFTLLLGIALVILLFSGCPNIINYTPRISLPDQIITEGATLTIDLTKYAEDTNLDQELTFKILSGVGEIVGSNFVYTAGIGSAGIYYVKLSVTDPWGSVGKDEFSITVIQGQAVNTPPTISIENMTIAEGETINLNLSDYATDTDNDSLSFELLTGPGAITNSNYVYSPGYDAQGDYQVSIRVLDTSNSSCTCSFLLTVNDVSLIGEFPLVLGGDNYDNAMDMVKTSDGGYIIAGSSMSANGDLTENNGSYDFWIIKLTVSGGVEWKTTFGGSSMDYARSITECQDGYVVVGFSESTDIDGTVNNGDRDVLIVKLNRSGSVLWKGLFGGTESDEAFSVQSTADNGWVVAGYTDIPYANETPFHKRNELLVLKFDGNGIMQWERTFGGSENDQARSITVLDDGSYVVLGYTESIDGDVEELYNGQDIWLLKLSSTGELEWEKNYGGYGNEIGNQIRQTADLGYVITCTSNSSGDDVSGHHGDELFDWWVVKLTSDGTITWERSLGGNGNDYSDSVIETSDGYFVAAGESQSSDGDVDENHGDSDYWIVKLSPSGTLLWEKNLGGEYYDAARAVEEISPGKYLLAGVTYSDDTDVSDNHGESDIWIVEVDDPPID